MCISIPRSGFIPTSVKLRDFCPINKWEVNNQFLWSKENAPAPDHIGKPKHLIDETTGRRYWNETKKLVRTKCLRLSFVSIIAQPVGAVLNIAYRILKLVTLSHFWIKREGEEKYNFKARLIEAGKDLLRIVASPIAIIGLELAAIYGLMRPYDGRKLYATFERAIYGNALIPPCFQPCTIDPFYMRIDTIKKCFTCKE